MTLTIRLDTTDVLAASERIGALDMQMLRRVREDAVAAVSLSVRKQAVDETFRSLNVTRDYIEQRLERKTGRREGLLTQDLVISPVRGTTLQRFGAQVQTKPVNWSNERIEGMGKKFGPWPGWTRRTGDASRGIAAGQKSDGVSVDVNRKGMKRIATAFVMPLRNGNGFGVFRREGGRIKHKYGPSVFQVFRRFARDNQGKITDELQREFMAGLDARLGAI